MTTALANAVPVKQAIREAIEFVQSVYRESGMSIADVALEEIQPTDDGEYWNVTVGFFRPRDPNIDPMTTMLHGPLASRFDKTRQDSAIQARAS